MDVQSLADAVTKGDLQAVQAELETVRSYGGGAAVRKAIESCEYGKGRSSKAVLHCAAYDSHLPILRLLLDARASAGCTDDAGNNGLHWAAELGHARAARVLLEAGADKTAMNNFGRTPEQKAVEESWHSAPVKTGKECIRRMFTGQFEASCDAMPEQAPPQQPAPGARARGGAEQATSVCGVAMPMPPPLPPSPGRAPPPLVEEGAPDRGPRSLAQLVRADDCATIETQVNGIRDAAYAATMSRFEAQEAVIAAITNCEEGDRDQRVVHSPLHLAAALGRVEVLKYFLAQGASPNKDTDVGETPLHKAAAAGRHECILELLKAGGDPNRRSNFNRTPLDFAEPTEFDGAEMKYCKERVRIAFRGFNSKAAGHEAQGSPDDLASTAIPESSRGNDVQSDTFSVSIKM